MLPDCVRQVDPCTWATTVHHAALNPAQAIHPPPPGQQRNGRHLRCRWTVLPRTIGGLTTDARVMDYILGELKWVRDLGISDPTDDLIAGRLFPPNS